ncbi:hypothetical protein FRC00_000057, partial [Tulasnella sp. 408]
MRTLSTIRLVAKRWQQIVDGTPVFWKFIISTLPPHVNEATVTRSRNGPLTIIYSYGPMYTGGPRPYAEDFLRSLAHTFPRWSAYSGPLVSGYFHMPAPHLQTIILRDRGTSREALDLLGGSAKNLQHVHLSGIPIRWRAGLFAQLKILKLVQVSQGEFELTTTHILEILRTSPDLEHLELGDMHGPIDHSPASPVITHTRLRCIKLYNCGHNFAGAILRRIRAPSCNAFYVNEVVANFEQDLPIFLNEDLRNFKELLRATHSQNGSSRITLDDEEFGWNSLLEDVAEHLPTFSVFICSDGLIPCIEWVKDLIQDNPGLAIRFNPGASITQEVLDSIKPMRCVTRLEIRRSLWRDYWSRSLLALKLIGEPLNTNTSLPPLPYLQELLLTDAEWPPQSVLDMVRSRFNPSLWENTERTPLTIKMPRGASPANRLIFDLTTLKNIRETDGVELVQFVGSEKLDGNLAITWDEKKSIPTF